jgi:hypothetical protein
VLKRLKVTPLTAFEYLTAQSLSRIFLLMFTLVVVWARCDSIFSFTVLGSYLDLFLIFFIGSLSLTALGLVLASKDQRGIYNRHLKFHLLADDVFIGSLVFSGGCAEAAHGRREDISAHPLAQRCPQNHA